MNATVAKKATTRTRTKKKVPAQPQPQEAKVAGWALTGKLPTKPYRTGTARALWWERVQLKLDNGPVAASVLYKELEASPPSTPKNGKLAGACEPPAGWLGWLSRQGLVKQVQVTVTQK